MTRMDTASVQKLLGLSEKVQAAEPAKTGATRFSDKFDQALQSVDNSQNAADHMLAGLASGEHANLHGTMVALEKADISLRTMVSVRDKVVSAYESVMNMAI